MFGGFTLPCDRCDKLWLGRKTLHGFVHCYVKIVSASGADDLLMSRRWASRFADRKRIPTRALHKSDISVHGDPPGQPAALCRSLLLIHDRGQRITPTSY